MKCGGKKDEESWLCQVLNDLLPRPTNSSSGGIKFHEKSKTSTKLVKSIGN